MSSPTGPSDDLTMLATARRATTIYAQINKAHKHFSGNFKENEQYLFNLEQRERRRIPF